MSFTLLKKRSLIFFAILAYVIPLCITAYSIFSGSIAFWYDPARDLLSGLANLEKITLIGPTSGIPGLFYGPYWIWMISIGLLISHDPRIVAFVVAALPYFVVLPFVFYKLSSIIGKKSAIIGWLLFMLAYGGYSAQLWNPHPAPLLVFVLLTLMIFIPKDLLSLKNVAYVVGTGFIAGLLIQFHISFGIAVVSGVFVYQVIYFFVQLFTRSKKSKTLVNNLIINALLVLGILISALPFFVFEMRHGLNQIQTILNTLSTPHAVVGVTGISDTEIVTFFFERLGRLLSLPISVSIILGIVTLVVFGYQVKKDKAYFKSKNVQLLLLSTLIGVWVLLVYMTSRNPVWDYHFIGVEVVFVLLLISLISKSKILTYVYGVIVMYIAVMALQNLYTEVQLSPIRLTSLATKAYVVEKVFSDAPEGEFAFVAYNPAIHSYDYDYLSQWIAEKYHREVPSKETGGKNTVYLVIPPQTAQEITEDFINYRTPNTEYSTINTWNIEDGTQVLKRVKSRM